MTTAPGMAAAHPAPHDHDTPFQPSERFPSDPLLQPDVTIEDCLRRVRRKLKSPTFAADCRQLIAEGAELEYHLVIRPDAETPGAYYVTFARYIRTAPMNLLRRRGMK